MDQRHAWAMSMARAATLVFVASGLFGAVRAQPSGAAGAALECPRSRAEVRAECAAFLKTHRWSEQAGNWVSMSSGKAVSKLPEGVSTRAAIRAERDAFLRANRWNEATGQWEPLGPKPRDISKLSRAEVRKETAAFMKTHHWDEALATYAPQGK